MLGTEVRVNDPEVREKKQDPTTKEGKEKLLRKVGERRGADVVHL
jgi:hypothetical protein